MGMWYVIRRKYYGAGIAVLNVIHRQLSVTRLASEHGAIASEQVQHFLLPISG